MEALEIALAYFRDIGKDGAEYRYADTELAIKFLIEAVSQLEDRLRAVETSQLELAQETWKP